ncbi:hypothetical protein ACFX2I_007301 [Malus domestica]|uniref:Cytochrome b561 and DOMON domain-containing protein n=1 Tax=Malus domestica TaxID=3750 RepID=A0A498IHG9_MALDO|nr:hypothetical protein DVH24_003324 [Malus domestica]
MPATTKSVILIILTVSSSLLFPISEQFSNCSPINPMNITNCKKLITLGAEFGWNIHSNTEINILFTIRMPIKWIAWGVNPGSQRPQMVGTRAIIGIQQSNGTLAVRKYNITSDTKLGCRLQPSQDFDDVIVKNMRGEVNPRYMSISATLILPRAPAVYDISKLNHVWQVGFEADDVLMEPKMHSTSLQNVDSTESINMISGRGLSIGHRRHHLRTVHGILNILGWGTMLPLGVIIARYFRKYPVDCEKWYIVHVSCQIVGYTLGTAGWAIGLWLGHASRHYSFSTHRILAICIFAFTTLQMLALRLRPSATDDYRKYWDMYHHFLGYALLALISVNIFHGIAILKPNKTWLWVYIGVLGMFALVAIGLEIFTWRKFMHAKSKRRQTGQPGSQPQGSSGT